MSDRDVLDDLLREADRHVEVALLEPRPEARVSADERAADEEAPVAAAEVHEELGPVGKRIVDRTQKLERGGQPDIGDRRGLAPDEWLAIQEETAIGLERCGDCVGGVADRLRL